MIQEQTGDAQPSLSSGADSTDTPSGDVDERMHIQSKSPRRVKVYLLQGDDWLDNGTGYCMGKVDVKTQKPYFIVRNELDSEDIILRSYLEGSIQYQRQQETLIVWSDSSGKDLALSFQENEGCADLCDFIVKVQQENLSPMISLYYVITSLGQEGINSDGPREITELIAGPITYPPTSPVSEGLAEMLEIFAQGSNSLYSRFKILSFVIEHNYLSRLYALFLTCEKKRDLKSLHLLNDIMKTLLIYNETLLLNEFFARDESIIALAAMLEYDREYPNHKAGHRDALAKEFKFECLKQLKNIPTFPDTKLSILRMEHVLVYFRSVFVSLFFDDHVIGTLSSMIYKCQLELLNYLRRSLANGNFLELLFLLYASNDLNSEQKRDGIRMIHNFAMVAKCHVAAVKPEFFGTLIKSGFSKMIPCALNDEDPAIRSLGTELVVTVLDQDVTFSNSVSNEEQHVDEMEDLEEHASNSALSGEQGPHPLRLNLIFDVNLIVSLSRVLLESRIPGLQMQAFEALKSVLYAASAEISAVNEDQTSEGECIKKADPKKSAEIAEKHYHQFYTSVAPILFEDFFNLLSDDPIIKDKAQENLKGQPGLYQHLCDIISFCCREHGQDNCCSFLLETGLLKGLFVSLSLRSSALLKLAVIRALKSIVLVKNTRVSQFIVDHNLMRHFFSYFEKVSMHNSCANSLCLDLLSVIEKRAFSDAGFILAADISKKYRDFLETKLEYVSIGRTFLKTYEAAENERASSFNGKKYTRRSQVSSDQLSSPILDERLEGDEEPSEPVENGVQSRDLFQGVKVQNGAHKRQRDDVTESSLRNGDCSSASEAKRKAPVLWADKPNLEEETCS